MATFFSFYPFNVLKPFLSWPHLPQNPQSVMKKRSSFLQSCQ